jgi:hypothetical protein
MRAEVVADALRAVAARGGDLAGQQRKRFAVNECRGDVFK